MLTLGKATEYSDGLEEIVEEFQKAFPNREWKEDDMQEVLYCPSYSRSIERRREDYPIIRTPEFKL